MNDNREFDDWEADRPPPLRDSYQTATLRTVLLALRDLEQKPPKHTMAPEPRLFEIGRTRPVELPTLTTEPLPDHYNLLAPGRWTLTFSVAAILIALGLGAIARNRNRFVRGVKRGYRYLWRLFFDWSFRNEPEGPHPSPGVEERKSSWLGPSTLILAGAVILGLTLLGLLWWDLHTGGEPLSFVQGVSVWPSEILRTLAGVLAVWFFIHGHTAQVNACNALQTETFPGLLLPRRRKPKSKPGPCLGLMDRPSGPLPKNAEDIWQDYRETIGMRRTLRRIWVEVVLYFLLAMALMLAFGFPNRPVRSDLSWYLDLGLTLFAVIPFLLLLFYLVDATRQALTVSKALSKPVSWPAETLENLGLGAWVETNGRGADVVWLDVKLIGAITEPVGELIWYPMLFLAVIALARASVFDAWALSPALIVVFAIGFIYAIGSAFMLRSAAEEVREDARRQLERALARALDCPASAACVERLRTLLDKVANARLGAFRPFSQQPAVGAILTFLGSISGLKLMEYLSMANL